jgi:PDZ domain/Aspartyl protease
MHSFALYLNNKMKMNRIRFISFIAILTLLLCGQSLSSQNTSDLTFSDSSKTRLVIPFKLVNNLIIIELKINGFGPYNFILDSGLSSSIFIEPKDQDSLLFKNSRPILLKGLGEAEALKAIESRGNSLEFGGIIGNDCNFYVLNTNLLNLSSKLGIPINGIIGYPVFRDFILEIKYTKRLLIFHKADNFKYKGRYKRYTSIPLIINQTKPYINAKIVDQEGNARSLKTLLDTGASHALWSEEQSVEGLKIHFNNQPVFLGSGLNGEVFGKFGRLNKLYTGPFEMDNVIIYVPDSSSISKAMGINERDGSIGAEVLRRYHIIFDFPHQKLSLKKNNHFQQEFTQNKSGMEITVSFSAQNRYFIYEVRKNSPADIAGLEPGDQIIQIDQNPVSGLRLDEIYSFLHGKHGKILHIRYIRNQKPNLTVIKLENFI